MIIIVPVIVWGIRLESRVDHEFDLRQRLEIQINSQNDKFSKQLDNIQRNVEDIGKGMNEIRISLAETRANQQRKSTP
jgi:hypothetical protein